MKLLPRLTALLLALLGAHLPARAAEAPAFAPGERWAVLGDSITHSGAYPREIELFYLTRHPGLGLETANCGIAGDTATGALRRLDWDVLPTRPGLVSVMFGMNDVGRHLYADAPGAPAETIAAERAARAETYERSMRALVGRLRAAGARVVLLQPSPFDDTARIPKTNLPGCGAALAGYAAKVRALADELGVAAIDFTGPMTELNRRLQTDDPAATLIGPDRVHPGRVGHLVMAYLFLRAQEAPGFVYSIMIDAANGRAGVAENTTLSALVASPGSVAFTSAEMALPFPVEAESAPALALVPFTDSLNRQTFRVTGLAPGDYRLLIDDFPVGQWPAERLAAGVNLADLPDTPQLRQARAVRAALARKWEAEGKLRTLAYTEHGVWPDAPRPLDVDALKAKITERLGRPGPANPWVTRQFQLYPELQPQKEDLAALAASALAEARALARPRAHRYALAPLP